MPKGTVLYIAIALVFFLPATGVAQGFAELAKGQLIELPPVEVTCRPADDPAAEADTIILEGGQSPTEVCPTGRIAGLYFHVESLTGEPPPPPVHKAEASP